jgi:hypothetical protein
MGSFDRSISAGDIRMLSRHDVIILDPYQANIVRSLTVLRKSIDHSFDILGRLNLQAFPSARVETYQAEKFFVSFLDQIMNVALRPFRELDGNNRFTGILLAGWEILPIPVLHEFIHVLCTMGFDIYLEISAPTFLEESAILNPKSISGVVIRNGLLQSTGARRDCFDLEVMRTAVKSFVSQSCLRHFTVLMWETLDDDVVVSNALLKRTFNWCNFYGGVLWIGSQKALFNISIETLTTEPLSAFDWLKEPQVMELQNLWKKRRSVRPDIDLRINEDSNVIHSRLKPPTKALQSTISLMRCFQAWELRDSNAHANTLKNY